MSNRRVLKPRFTAAHFLENLAGDLYASPGHCLWELVRNGVDASMEPNTWQPDNACVEIKLCARHPLAGGNTALIILDHGRGFTEPDIERYTDVGPSVERIKNRKQDDVGSAQKGIGRFSGLALNRLLQEKDYQNTGFFVLTRTRARGEVRMLKIFPRYLEEGDFGFPYEEVDEYGAEMSILKNIHGSFTAIVIPNPVFTDYESIREALRWRLPRTKDKAFTLLVDEQPLNPPPLATKVTKIQPNGKVQVYVDVVKDDKKGGIWLTDARTGLRVTPAASLGYQYLPDPLYHERLVGDIMVPNLLVNQDTSRSGLKQEFLRSKEWQSVFNYLALHVKSEVEALLGNDIAFGTDSVSRSIDTVIGMCEDAWGKASPPEVEPAAGLWKEDSDRQKRISIATGGARRKSIIPTSGNKKKRQRIYTKHIRIGDKSFAIARRTLNPHLLALVDPGGHAIYINNDGYIGLPSRKDARLEHTLIALLNAVAAFEHQYDAVEAVKRVGELRAALLKKA